MHLAVAVELVAAEVAEHEQLGAERVDDAGHDALVDLEHGGAGRLARSRASGAIPDVRLAPVELLTTGCPSASSAAASSRVVVVLPLVAETSATR